MEIFGKEVSIHSPAYFIAEIGSNFDGNLKRAKELIKVAADSGADAVKFQHYTANTLISDKGFSNLDSNIKTHQSNWKESVSSAYDKASLDKDWTESLCETAHSFGVGFLTSPYSLELVDCVEPYIDAYKIGSGDITYSQIVTKIASKGKPILIAAGASTLDDVETAMTALSNDASNICLMQCNTNYEGLLSNAGFQNLLVLKQFQSLYPRAVLGLSCHMPGWTSVIGAIAIGARVIEKHFTDDRSRPGPDHGFATNPVEWKKMVEESRMLESMLGDGIKKIEGNELKTVVVQQRSIRVKEDLEIGTIIREQMFEYLRPCPTGAMKPSQVSKVLLKTLTKKIKKGEHLTLNHLT